MALFKIKVCGMRDRENVKEVCALSPDYMGFIFYPPSPRNCLEIEPEVVRSLSEKVEAVAVVVNMPEEEILSLRDRYGFRYVQLHGDESPEMCRQLRAKGFKVFKAIGVKDTENVASLWKYDNCVDMFLFDTASSSRGGTGRKFDWELLKDYDIDIPFLLSGGIGAGDADVLKGFSHPQFQGIDLNSRFEKSPGHKDVEQLKKFFKEIRE